MNEALMLLAKKHLADARKNGMIDLQEIIVMATMTFSLWRYWEWAQKERRYQDVWYAVGRVFTILSLVIIMAMILT